MLRRTRPAAIPSFFTGGKIAPPPGKPERLRISAGSLPADSRPPHSVRLLEGYGADHPLVAHFRLFPTSPPVSISDLCTETTFRASRLCTEHFAPLNIQDQVAACLSGPEPLVLAGAHHGKWGIGKKRSERLGVALPQMTLAYARLTMVGGGASEISALSGHALRPRHKQVLALVLEGMRTTEIAASLGISPFTVRDYLAELYEAFGVSGRPQLMARHMRRNGSRFP